MTVFEKLCDKIDVEMEDFKSHYAGLTPLAVYNDAYKINFYESFKNLLCNDYVGENEYNVDILSWLADKGSPIGFLHETYMSSDCEMSYDWDDMMEWIKDVYFEEKRLEKQELHYKIKSLGLQDVSASKDEYFEGFNCVCNISNQPVIYNLYSPSPFDENLNKEFTAFFRDKLLVKSCDYGRDTYPGGVDAPVTCGDVYTNPHMVQTYQQQVWNFIEDVEQMFGCECQYYKACNGFEFVFEFGSEENQGCYVFGTGNNGQEFCETLYLTDWAMIRDPQVADTIITIDRALYTLLEEHSLRREDKAASLDDVIKGAEEQKAVQKDAKALGLEFAGHAKDER